MDTTKKRCIVTEPNLCLAKFAFDFFFRALYFFFCALGFFFSALGFFFSLAFDFSSRLFPSFSFLLVLLFLVAVSFKRQMKTLATCLYVKI